MSSSPSVAFFERQFERQARSGDHALNPFELAVLPHLQGDVLDIGCGMGNLALAAAGRGCRVIALDASTAGIASLGERARAAGAEVVAQVADARTYEAARTFDAVVSIGLLMFFDCATAAALLRKWQAWVRPGGVMAVNVLVEGTSYREMFGAGEYCLWKPDDLDREFAGWIAPQGFSQSFDAPGGTVKRFRTVLATKPRPQDFGASVTA